MDRNTVWRCERQRSERIGGDAEPRAIGEVLAELFAAYRARFPGAQFTVVGSPEVAPEPRGDAAGPPNSGAVRGTRLTKSTGRGPWA